MTNSVNIQLTEKEIDNLIDTLTEWYEVVQPKELGDEEIGLNVTRYWDIMYKFKKAQNELS